MTKIYIDRLKSDKPQIIEETLDSHFMNIDEEGLKFLHPITIVGQAYLATPHCILTLRIETKATIPCSICNENVEIPILIPQFTHSIELADVKSKIYDFSSDVRDTILLKAPHFAECGEDCPHRKELDDYLKKSDTDSIMVLSESNY